METFDLPSQRLPEIFTWETILSQARVMQEAVSAFYPQKNVYIHTLFDHWDLHYPLANKYSLQKKTLLHIDMFPHQINTYTG